MSISKPAFAASLALASLAIASTASAQQPPQGYVQVAPAPPAPPPQYVQVQPGYAPPPGYVTVAPPPPPPRALAYKEGDAIPAGYHPESHVRKGLVVGGTVMLGSLWLISSITAAAEHDAGASGFDALYVPCVGPFIAMGTAKDSSSATGNLALAIDGIAQTGGLAMTVAGFALTSTTLVQNDAVTVRAAPIVAGSGMGFGLRGTL